MEPRARLAAFVHPLAAAIVFLCGALIAWRPAAPAAPDFDHMLRLFPFDTRWDARVGIGVAAVAALLVASVARGKAGRWLRRALGVAGLAIVGAGAFCVVRTVRNDCHRWEGCDFWRVPSFLVDAALLLLASAALLVWARREPGRRLRWIGAGAVVALAIASAAWTYRATPTLHRYSGEDLAGVRLQGFFETNDDDFIRYAPSDSLSADPADWKERVPPAVPALPMRGERMLCLGDWRTVKFPDRDRCLPLRPMVTVRPDDVEVVSVTIPHVGGPPEIAFTLRSEAARNFAAALRTARNFRLVLLNGRGALVADLVPASIPGRTFGIKPGAKGAAETERMLRALLDRPSLRF